MILAFRFPLIQISLLAAAGFCQAESGGLVVESPEPDQIVQRRTVDEGVVRISGKASAGAAQVRFRVAGQPGNGWMAAQVGADGRFDAELGLRPGKWQEIEVEAVAGEKVLGSAKIGPVAAGEVFLVAGQSNAGNFGSERQQSQSGMVRTFDGAKWHPANDPQPGAGGSGGSFLPAFGDAMAKRLGVPVGLVPVAQGGTSVREWLPTGIRFKQNTTTGGGVKPVGDEFESNGVLFGKLTAPMKKLGVGGFRAVLWHQGESDAGQARSGYPADRQISGVQYGDFMEQLIRRSRNAAGWPVPWFTAVTTYHSESDPGDAEFRGAMQALWSKGLSWPGPDTDALRREWRDGVHFNAKGLQKHGELWADAVGPWVEQILAPPQDGPPSKDYQLVWQDEFEGKELDKTKWDFRGVGERKGAWIAKETVTLDGDGHLILTVRKNGGRYEGAMIGTEKQAQWTFGYFECRLQLATEPGMNTAFWLQSPLMSAPDQGKGAVDDTAKNGTEIDILEYIARQGEVAHFNLHWNGYGKAHKSHPSDIWMPGLTRGFHTYAVEWTAEGYTFYIDGRRVWHTTQAISKRDQYLILDLEVSPWAGGIESAKLPATAVVDWVRVWQKR
jgi:hypothetical protein